MTVALLMFGCLSLLTCVALQARVNMSSSSIAPYRLFGNTTTAQDGVAKFTGLTVNGKPGDTVTLVFRTQNGLTVSRQVILRSCQAGEYTDNSTSVPNELSFSCRSCQSPQYSFYPSATGCSQCASLPPESWAVCNEAAVVPADGFYQSHPRSPVVSAVCECADCMQVFLGTAPSRCLCESLISCLHGCGLSALAAALKCGLLLFCVARKRDSALQ